MDTQLVSDILIDQGLFEADSKLQFKSLEGGVSSDIMLVTDGKRSCVVKQALPKLQVEDDWYADIERNKIEQDFTQFLAVHKPRSVPELLYSDEEHHLIVMEYLGEAFYNWKQQMLQGQFNIDTARKAARLLAEIHRKSWQNEELKQRFNNAENFHSLRTEPYLVTTGERHPELKNLFWEEAKRLRHHRQALVHGDFSPKNIMISDDRLVLLDHEVAWFGDPAFDLAFLLNHLYLKMLVQFRKQPEIQDLTSSAWDAYFGRMGASQKEEMEPRVGRLLLMLMLARVDGKSPVEYLLKPEKKFIRSFVHKHLPRENFSQHEINQKWKSALKGEAFDD